MRTALTLSSGLVLASCTNEYDLGKGVDVDPGDVTECGFTPIPDTKLSVYDCNPVFAGTGEAWGEQVDAVGFHATQVLGHAFYQIWYSAAPDGTSFGDWGLGYAVSNNGTDWEAHPNNPLLAAENGEWDQDAMDAIQVVWDPDNAQYLLAYQGYNIDDGLWGMGVATSDDGVDWVRSPTNPVLDFTATISGVSYCWPLAVTLNSLDEGFIGYIAGQPSDANVCQVYPVFAPDLSDWQPNGSPVLEAGPEYYDAAGMAGAAVVEYDGTFYMFYSGFEEWVVSTGYQSSRYHTLNLATSSDGISWNKSPRNPMPVGLTEEGLVTAVAAQVVDSRIHLWVTDYYEEVGGQAVGYYLFEPDIEAHPAE